MVTQCFQCWLRDQINDLPVAEPYTITMWVASEIWWENKVNNLSLMSDNQLTNDDAEYDEASESGDFD